MDTNITTSPELPPTNSTAALLLLVVANRRSARQHDVSEDAAKWEAAIAYANQLGWHIAVGEDGVAYADTVPAPRGFADWWSYLRSRANSTDNFKAVVRQSALPRISAMARQLSQRPGAAAKPSVTLQCDYGDGELLTTVVPIESSDKRTDSSALRSSAVAPLGAAPLGSHPSN